MPENAQVDEGGTLNVSISAEDPDEKVKPLQFKLLSGPPGLNFDLDGATNAIITWDTSEETGPSTNVIEASVTDVVDGRSFTRTNSFTVIVREINLAPTLTVPSNQTVAELTLLSFSASATDPDIPANPLAFSLVAPPEGMTIDPASGVIFWTPTEAQGPSTNVITVVVTDDSPSAANAVNLSATNSFVVVVEEINTPPQLTVPSAQVVDEQKLVALSASALDTDFPANGLVFTLVSGPAGMTVNATTGTISWAPTEEQGPSTNLVAIAATDSNPLASNAKQLSVTNSFSIIVRDVNSAPLLQAQQDRTLDEMSPLTVANAATDADLPANTLSYALVNAPSGAAIDSSGVITWTPSEAQGPSTNLFTTVVSDNGSPTQSATNTFTVIVRELNTAPTLEAVADRSVHFDADVSIQFVGADADLPANSLTYSLLNPPSGATIDASTGMFTWKPVQSQVGAQTIQVRLSDNAPTPLSVTNTFVITVTGEGSRLGLVRLSSGLIQLDISGDVGFNYELQRTTDFVTWEKVIELRLNSPSQPVIDPASATASSGFYRLLLLQ
jgi:hypothetical protein